MWLRANPTYTQAVKAVEPAEGDGDSDSERESDSDTLLLLRLRWLLPPAKAGEKVVFRCPFDGWYYQGIISKDNEDFSYIVIDCNNDPVIIWREDIICDDDRKADNLNNGDTVVVLHPDYIGSYCPGQIERDESSVQLCDGRETTIGAGYIARLSPNKYRSDVTVMKALAEAWNGKTVVARCETGEYHIGTVTGLAPNSCSRYNIQWDSSSPESTVEAIHVFGSLTPHRTLDKDDHVLAPAPIQADPDTICYLPAKIKSVDGVDIVVTFQLLPRNNRETVKKADCFWIAERYYHEAILCYLQHRT